MPSPYPQTSALAGLMAVLLTVGAAAQPPFEGMTPFQAIGTIDQATVAVNVTCADGSAGIRMSGALRGNEIGSGTYTMCLDAPMGPHQPWSPGTLTFTRDDRTGTLVLNLAIMRLSNYQATATYLGTYEVDTATALTGVFAGRLVGGSGLVELSQPSRLVFLNGLLKSP